MALSQYVETLNLLGDESRIRLCALLRERELCVSDLVRVTGMAQSRVSTHLGRLREAGFVWDRRQGTQCFYGLALDALPGTAKAVLDEAEASDDPTLIGDQKRLQELEAERRGGLPESVADELERYYSPGRTWQSLALGIAALLKLGDVLDVGSGDGAAAASLAPHTRSLTCIDTNARLIEVAKDRLARFPQVTAQVADVHQLPFADASFDEVIARYGERHPGFSPRAVRNLLSAAGLDVRASEIASREAKKPHLEVVLAIGEKAPQLPKKRTS